MRRARSRSRTRLTRASVSALSLVQSACCIEVRIPLTHDSPSRDGARFSILSFYVINLNGLETDATTTTLAATSFCAILSLTATSRSPPGSPCSIPGFLARLNRTR